MSHQINEVWLQTAYQTFTEALEAGQWGLAEEIMADTRDNGFEKEWQTMYKEYNFSRFEDR